MAQQIFDPNDPLNWLDEYEGENTGGGQPPTFTPPTNTPPPNDANQFVLGQYGQYTNYPALPAGTPSGDPQYNARQREFEGQTDWNQVERDLQEMAQRYGVEYDRSDLMGRQRNAGYDAAHQGAGGGYASALAQSMAAAEETYRQRAGNTPGQTSGRPSLRSAGSGGGAGGPLQPSQNYSGPGSPGVMSGPVQQVGQDPFSGLLTNTISAMIENAGFLDPDRMAMRQEASREVLDRQRRSQLNANRGELADRNLLSVPGIPQGTDLASILRVDERLAPSYASAARDVIINEQDQAEERLSNALGLGTARQAMLGQLALEALDQNMEWNMFLATLGLNRDQLMYEIQNGQVQNIIPLIQLFTQQAQTAAQGRI